MAAVQAIGHNSPPCLRCCGIMPAEVPELKDTLAYEATTPTDRRPSHANDLAANVQGLTSWMGEAPQCEEGWII
eukprot:3567789-Karenia_brevis.AAC.1